ncbi:hypothetical protein GCM10010327_57550 [Streptomyces nitrosporeus]|nr:hypothetical protein GCM10010327_57550 [Streptomyces nitrosporeus]
MEDTGAGERVPGAGRGPCAVGMRRDPGGQKARAREAHVREVRARRLRLRRLTAPVTSAPVEASSSWRA